MFSFYDRPIRLCDSINRRQWLKIGGLATAGISLPGLLRAAESRPLSIPPTDTTFGRAKNVIFLYQAGGPPQHETFDPKPGAAAEIRGAFQPISTCVPGIQFCELLPRTARLADKLAVVRSMSTNDNTHSSSGAWVLTGHKYVGPNPRTIQPTDWPYFGSLVKKLRPSEELTPLSTVWIPDMMRLNENVTPAGQTAGFLGSQWNPDRFIGNPDLPDYKIDSLWKYEVPTARMHQRQSLLAQFESHVERAARSKVMDLLDQQQLQAFDLLTSGKAREAFSIQKEPEKVRRRYGRNQWGQCVLLARRLIEAGVRLVHVQWPREPGDNAVDNPLWDTHAQNAERLEDVLCPIFDVGFSALIEDLDQRGLLAETLVVAIGEFGRTPKINAKGGRDHWGPVFSFALAGAGISGAQVYGKSDKDGAYPIEDRVEPGDLTATIFHLLGINFERSFIDRQGRPHPLTLGRPLMKLLGDSPATNERRPAGGNPARVPPFDPQQLLANTDFSGAGPIGGDDGPSRPRGWRAHPLEAKPASAPLQVRLIAADKSRPLAPQQHAAILIGAEDGEEWEIKPGAQAFLAQEVRSPFAGTYRFAVQLIGDGPSQEFYENVFQQHFTCRLELFTFTNRDKHVADRKPLAALAIAPPFRSDRQPKFATFEVSKQFENPQPGRNFSFGLGLGVAIVVEQTSQKPLHIRGPNESALIRIADVELEFNGKAVNEDVTV